MRLRLVRIMAPKGTDNRYFVKRIPTDIRDRMVGRKLVIPMAGETVNFEVTPSTQSIRFSLKVPGSPEAKLRHAEVVAYIEQYFEWVRSGRIVELSHQQITALAGVFYRRWSGGPDSKGKELKNDARAGTILSDYDPNDDELRDEIAAMEQGAGTKASAHRMSQAPQLRLAELGGRVDELAQRHGFPQLSEKSRNQLLSAILYELGPARERAAKVFRGDYSADERLKGQPDIEVTTHQKPNPPTPAPGKVSLTGLEEAWWAEAKTLGKSESTHESYRNSFALLSRFLKHNDASRVTPENIIAFKDHRLSTINPKTGKSISPKTIKGSDLTAFKSVFDWAVANRKLPSNPAVGVTLKLGKKTKLRERDFTDAEAAALLAGANAVDLSPTPRNSLQTRLAKRWVPWLCAYSGSRVGELVQLRKEDFREEAGTWIMQVTPEAGTVKTKEYRDVPVHPHLIEMGFMEFVKKAPAGHLFMEIKQGKSFHGVWQSKKNRLAEFAREYVKDPNVAPNHGWRHTFKSKGFEAGIQEKVLDALCGHAPSSVGRAYGSVTLKTKVDAMEVFPRYQIKREG